MLRPGCFGLQNLEIPRLVLALKVDSWSQNECRPGVWNAHKYGNERKLVLKQVMKCRVHWNKKYNLYELNLLFIHQLQCWAALQKSYNCTLVDADLWSITFSKITNLMLLRTTTFGKHFAVMFERKNNKIEFISVWMANSSWFGHYAQELANQIMTCTT